MQYVQRIEYAMCATQFHFEGIVTGNVITYATHSYYIFTPNISLEIREFIMELLK